MGARTGFLAVAASAGGAALWGAGRRRRAARHLDFRGAVVAVTGGSRGRGLMLAREFAAEGARLALLARPGRPGAGRTGRAPGRRDGAGPAVRCA